ncbi:hypothetical protein ASD83_06835 [Devosia sp. Root685]|nr:hypothetical protein ASD83_06835 [Devosia sp. Root685]
MSPRADEMAIWDAGIHIYRQGWPLAPTALSKPDAASLEDYRRASEAVGTTHVVLSQPTAYGFDNTVLLDALHTCGDRARGIVVVPPDTPPSSLLALHQQGVRGVRFMMFPGGVLSWHDVSSLAAKAADLNWVLKFQITAGQFVRHADLLASLPARLVIDVYPATLDRSDETAARLIAAMAAGRTWISLSAPADDQDPKFDEMARRLILANAARCIWASNWPGSTGVQHGLAWLNKVAGPDIADRIVQNASDLLG